MADDMTDERPTTDPEELRREILRLTREYQRAREERRPAFQSGASAIPYAGRVYDADEVVAAVGSSLDFWLTLGPEGSAFEREFAAYLDRRFALLVNSGSSANLVAFAALTSHLLDRPVRPGDEVITVAAGFPTTVNPILQHGCVPVFVDIDPVTCNVDVEQLASAVTERTRAVMLAHTLGNPFDIAAVRAICDEHDLFLIEDNCDALGSRYDGRLTGTFGDIGTSSFYPPHHITMGEGGAVYMNDGKLKRAAESIRDWGRDCWCASGQDDTCGKRFDWDWPALGSHGSSDDGSDDGSGDGSRDGSRDGRPTLPKGYDHKYVYSHVGYNLKPTDIQAAIGREQMKKLPAFVDARRHNHALLRSLLVEIEDDWQFMEATANSEPSWFALLMIMRSPDHERMARFCRRLDEQRVGNRRLFGGNLLWQPAYRDVPHRVHGALEHTDHVGLGGVFLGVYPGLTAEMIHALASIVIQQWKRG